MIRTIVHIDQEKCNGCGACAAACHEGAIGMIGGKAYLLRDDYCDGLGDCLPACPTGAITFEEREAAPYDPAAVEQKKEEKAQAAACGCPGSAARTLRTPAPPAVPAAGEETESRLMQWPVQIKLVPTQAPWYEGAHVLVAADCAAYAYAAFHRDFMAGRITLIGCPKLDGVDYSEKLTEIVCRNRVAGVTVVRMQVPCCGGLEQAVRRAAQAAGIPVEVVTLTAAGEILSW